MSGVNDTVARPRKKQVLMAMKKIDSIDEMEDVVSVSKTIELVAKQIESTQKLCVNSSGEVPQILMENIVKILSYWTGCTYVGKRKGACAGECFPGLL